MENENTLQEILRRLDVLIALELTKCPDQDVSMADRIQRLADIGLAPAQIASILSKSSNYVSATLSRRRKAKRKGKAKDHE